MKHRRVLGLSARCALSSPTHGLRPRRSLARHAALAVASSQVFSSRHVHTSPPETWTITAPLRPSIHPHSSASPDELPVPMGEQLRHMMRLLPHSVVVCTSADATSPRGMTVSSFTSLSLAPPLVTFHVAAPSRTLSAIRSCSLLNFHVLSSDVHGAKVAHYFTGGNTGHIFSEEALRTAGMRVDGWDGDGDAGDKLVVEDGVPPVLKGKGVMYVLRCKLSEEVEGGVVMVRDHAIVVAEVVEIVETSERVEGHERFGLLYADRHYRQLGPAMVRKVGEGER